MNSLFLILFVFSSMHTNTILLSARSYALTCKCLQCFTVVSLKIKEVLTGVFYIRKVTKQSCISKWLLSQVILYHYNLTTQGCRVIPNYWAVSNWLSNNIVMPCHPICGQHFSECQKILNPEKKIWKDRNAYCFLFVRIVNRFLSKELVLVNSTIFADSGILVFIYLYQLQ